MPSCKDYHNWILSSDAPPSGKSSYEKLAGQGCVYLQKIHAPPRVLAFYWMAMLEKN